MVTDEELEQLAGDFMKVNALIETAAHQMKGLENRLTLLLNGKDKEDGHEEMVSEPHD